MSGLRDYAAAAALADAGVTEIASYAGGRSRRVYFEHRDGGKIAARMFQTDIVVWDREGRATVAIGGYNILSTFDGIAAALGISRARVGMVKKVPYVNGANLSDGSVVLDVVTGREVFA